MAKYIPLDDLVVEIENRIKSANNDVKIGAIESLIISKTLNGFKSFLNTIEVKEVDLKKEVNSYMVNEMKFLSDEVGYDTLSTIAKHFFELGLNASNPIAEVDLESFVRQVIDLYLEAGKHYDSVIKEERKEYSGSDLAIKLLGGNIDAKELGIQYVLDKLKVQKGE